MLNATPLVCLRAGADETVAYAVSGAMSAWQSEWRFATAAHHSFLRVSSASTQSEYVAGPAPVSEYVAPAPAVFDAASAPVTYHEAFPRVVGSLPPGEVFAAPVFNQVLQEQFSAGETTANIANIPVVREQVLVQAIPRFVGSLPPVEGFTAYVARRPPPLVEVQPSVRAQRHVVEQLADIAPMVQILDSPEPQLVVQLLEVFRLLDTQLPDEQVISVPKVSCPSCPSRSRVPEPQSADQLVEVPTVLTPTRIAVQIAEQIVDTPVHLPESAEWVQLRDEVTSRPYFWNRSTRETKWKPPPGFRVVWARRGRESRSGTGTRKHVPVRMPSLLCLLSEELHHQRRAVFKYWAPCRLYFPLRPLVSGGHLFAVLVRQWIHDVSLPRLLWVELFVFSAILGSTVALRDASWSFLN